MSPSSPPSVLGRAAGTLALLHVALFVAAAALSGQPTVHEGQQGIEHSFNDGDTTRLMAAGYLLVLGFLAVVPVMVLLGRSLGARSEAGQWAARSAAAAGLAHVVVVVGSGLSAGAAAVWANDHQAELETVLAVNNIRNFAYFLALPLAGAFVLGAGLAALADGAGLRWAGWGSVAVGVALVLSIPAAAVGLQFGMPLLLLWWLCVGVALVRRRPPERRVEPVTAGSASGR